MEIRIRHIDDATATHFTDCKHTELEDVISLVERSGGVYAKGDVAPFHSYQLVQDETGAYAEILIGTDD